MKLTDTQVNELIAAKKRNLKTGSIGSWCDPQHVENLVCDNDLWDEYNTLESYMTLKQANRYTDEISLEIYKAIAREIRKCNPLLAAAFDATK